MIRKVITKVVLPLFIAIVCSNNVIANETQQANLNKRILLIADIHSIPAKIKLLKAAAESQGIQLDNINSSRLSAVQAETKFRQYELVLFDGLALDSAKSSFIKYRAAVVNNQTTKFELLRITNLAGLTKSVSPQQHDSLTTYYHNGGRHNFNALMAYVNKEFFGAKDIIVPAPQILPDEALYHPDFPTRVTNNKQKFYSWLNAEKGQNIVSIAMHRSVLESEQTKLVDSIMAKVEQQGGKAFAFYYAGEDKQRPYTNLLMENDKSIMDVIINLRLLHYVEKRRTEFLQMGVPVIQAMIYRSGNQAAFEKAAAGVSATMTPYFLVLPETAGLIDSTIIAASDYRKGTQDTIDYQLQALVNRALAQANLRHKTNADKKLATLVWNYPPGEKNMGAAFLNVSESLEKISVALQRSGYQIEQKEEQYFIDNIALLLKPFYRTIDLQPLIDKDLVGYIAVDDYKNWLKTLPKNIQQRMQDNWGDPVKHPMVIDHQGQKSFAIPRMKMGNLIVLQQPMRSDDKEQHAKTYHSMKKPVNHYYLAAYLYIKQQFKADAIIHLGTHGSQEWLPGKERALSAYDPPHLAVGDLPVVYPYIIDNVGEAMQSKRRGRAVMVSHLTPGFARAGLYGEFAKFAQLYNDFTSLDEGGTKQHTRDEILSIIKRLKIEEELEWTEKEIADNFVDYLATVQDYLQEMAAESQPLGLHTFSVTPQDAHLITTIVQMLGNDFSQLIKDFESEHEIKVSLPEDLHSQKMAELDAVQLEDIAGFKSLWSIVIEKRPLQDKMNAELQGYVQRALTYYQDFNKQHEMQSLINALSGQYLMTGNGGDPIRNPEAIITGKNLIGFNPARVPTKAAWETGRELAENIIANYYIKYGRYPDKLAYSLWSLETMRHHGVLEAQIMATMGIKPKWGDSGMVEGTEVIPFNELKRPRVDVVLSATGLYRDAFPNVMLLLAKAIKEIATLKEQGNRIFENSQQLKQELTAQGMSLEDAEYLSSARIFSNESGAYGTGLAGASLKAGSWEKGNDAELADLYRSRMGYVFGADEKRWSEKVEGDLYGKVLSGTDAVIFSRSTNLYGMLTRDDPFQYFGGIALAIRNLDGANPEMLVSNLRDPKQAKTESLKRFMAREMRSRAFHPRWIEEMQKEGYSGTGQILDRINNFWGWTMVDPSSVTQEQWQQWSEIYVEDKYDMQINEWFEKMNPNAQAQMIERMLEATHKNYWDADEETLKKLLDRYTELANRYDIYLENEPLREYIQNQSSGFGLNISLPNATSTSLPAILAESQPVEGQKLEKVEQATTESEKDQTLIWALLACLLFFVAGMFYQVRKQQVTLLFPS